MPAIAAAPAFYAAIATGAATTGAAVIGAKAQSSAMKRSTAAQAQAAAKAEAFEREQAAREDAEHARIEAEDRRRWDVDQRNQAAERAQADERLRMTDARQAYEDQLRYRKMVNLARLTGGPAPPPMPTFAMASGSYMPMPTTAPGAPIMAAPSRANAMIAPPGAFDPFTDMAAPVRGVPLSALNRRRI